MRIETKKELLGLSGIFLFFPNLLLLASAMQIKDFPHFDISSVSCFAIIGICGIIAGLLNCPIYGSRYYIICIIGYFLSFLISFEISCYCWSEFFNQMRKGQALASISGVLPVLFFLRYLKNIQDIFLPLSPEEKAISDRAEKELRESIDRDSREAERARLCRMRLILCVIPPIGFLVNYWTYTHYRRNEPEYIRRYANIGMWMSCFAGAAFLGAYLYVLSLGHGDPMGKAVNGIVQPGAAVGQNAPKAVPEAIAKGPNIITLEDYKKLVDRLENGVDSDRSSTIEQLLKLDPKKVPFDIVKSVAKGMKNIAFSEDCSCTLRMEAVKGMAKWGGSFSVPLLINLLNTKERAVRVASLQALADLKDPRAIEPAAKLYMTDFHESIAGNTCLAAFGSDAEDAVLKYFPPDDLALLKRGIEFLEKYGTKKSLKPLQSLRNREDIFLIEDEVNRSISAIQGRIKTNQQEK
jgi:hypothetical protein